MKTKIRLTIFAILTPVALAALAGCAYTPESRIKANPDLFASIAPANQALIRQGRVAIGFTPNMVLLALGEPDAVTQRTDAAGSTEIWRYQNYDGGSRTAVAYPAWGGYMTWGGPVFAASPRWGAWGGWGYGGYGGWGGWGGWGYPYAYWDSQPARSDYLRVSFRDGRVTEINRLR